MTQEEEQYYIKQIAILQEKQEKRRDQILLFQNKLNTVEDDEEIEKCIRKLDKLLKECKMDKELSEDLLNEMEVEHFLENGAGRNFDMEY